MVSALPKRSVSRYNGQISCIFRGFWRTSSYLLGISSQFLKRDRVHRTQDRGM